jgi:large conductance mechanosensitive channel
MPNLDELDNEETRQFVQEGQRRAKAVFEGFLDFAFSGNILEIAVGLM